MTATNPRMPSKRSADGLPALGIVAAVLGIIHAMGALDQSPEVLGGLIGAALVGTFGGIFLSYAVVAPIAQKIKASCGRSSLRMFTLVKQTLLAFMNGAMPQVAVEFGRKTIPAQERPTIDVVENETISGAAAGGDNASPRGRMSDDEYPSRRDQGARRAQGRDARTFGPRGRADAGPGRGARKIRRRGAERASRRSSADPPGVGDDRNGPGDDALSGDRRLRRPDRSDLRQRRAGDPPSARPRRAN